MSEEIKDIMDALENNELKNDGFWGRACSRLSQQLQTAKEENEKVYVRLYKIKDSQLKNPVNDMDAEDLAIEELLYEIEESFTINDTTINNLTQQNKQMREALDKISKVKLYNMPVKMGEGEKNYLKWYDLEHNAGLNMQDIAQQALKGVEE